MKRRTSLGLAGTLALTFALLAPAVLQGQKAKPVKPAPPQAISTSVWLDNGPGNTIMADGDPSSPYPASVNPQLRAGTTNVYDYYLAFWVRYGTSNPAANRSVVYDFGLPRYVSGDTLRCYPTEDYRQDRAKVPYLYAVPTFLTTGITEDTEGPLWVSFQTGDEWERDENGDWRSLGHFLDLGPYVTGSTPPAGSRYVELRVEFRTPELVGQDAYAYVAHNGPTKTPDSYGTTRGLVEVTSAAGGGFSLKPVEGGLSGALPTAYLYSYGRVPFERLAGANEANLTIKVPLGSAVGFKAWYGICDAGTFDMPFAITVKK